MLYQGLFRASESAQTDLLQRPGILEKAGRLMEQMACAGILDSADCLLPDWCGARVTLAAGEFTITSRTLIERKEPATPCAMFQVESLADAIAWTKCFLQVLGEGECEIRPLACAAHAA